MSPALDYARIADLYDWFVRFQEDIPFFRRQIRQADGQVAELMAGTGRLSVPLLEAGLSLTCIDSSLPMLAVLRGKLSRQGLRAPLLCQDVTHLGLRSVFDLAVLPFHSFSELVSEGEQQRALGSVYRALRPRGRFICTLHNPVVRLQSIGHGPTIAGRFPAGDEGGELVLEIDLRHDADTGIVSGVETFVRSDAKGDNLLRRQVSLRFRLLLAEDFEKLSRTSGFEVEALWGDYDQSPFDPKTSPYQIWSLRKP